MTFYSGFVPNGLTQVTSPIPGSVNQVGPPSAAPAGNQPPVFVDSNGQIWAYGSGGWFAAGSGVELASADLSADPAAATTVVTDIAGMTMTFTAPARAFVLELTIPLYTLAAAADDLVFNITDGSNVVVAQGLGVGGNASFPVNGSALIIRARLPRTGGANAYPITPGTSYTFKARQATGAGTANINTNNGQYRPILRAVTC